jgi:DNA-binding NarL/FixJ family response regulator
MNAIRILIADDHTLIRAGIIALLRDVKGVEVVAEASDGREAIDLIDRHHPDIVLTDIAMPRMAGLELTSRVVKDYPRLKVIILSMHSDEEYICQAFLAGAKGYLLKSSCTAELELAIRSVVGGETYLSPAISRQGVDDYISRTRGEARPPGPLTPRQLQVLRGIAAGKTTKAIARNLGISVKTVETHRSLLMERLSIRDVAGLVRYALRLGLVSPDE